MNLTKKRSKLIITLGPSSDNYEILRKLVINGATAIRANFSHGSYEEHAHKFKIAKEVSADLQIPISLILDTKGPEIRIGKMKNDVQFIKEKTHLKIHAANDKYQDFLGTNEELAVSYNMSNDLKEGNIVLFDDGKLTTKVIEVNKKAKYVIVETINSHYLKTNKRINLPGVDFSLPFLSEKDKKDVLYGIEVGVNYIAASFVNTKKNVLDLRKLLDKNGGKHIQIISKIESHLGIENIDEILQVSDGIMVARGDLGLEIPYYEVPYYEKIMIRKCREVGKPVIVATQMLDSMENTPHPTRAEVTDVYYATELGADSTMLSGETATGHYPIEAVDVMSKINSRAEREFYGKTYYDVQLEEIRRNSNPQDKRARIAYKVANKTRLGEYKYAIVLSRSGKLLKEVAKFRPNTLIIGIIEDTKLINGFGVTSSVWNSLDSAELFKKIKENQKYATKALKPYDVIKGDRFLVVENEKITEHTA